MPYTETTLLDHVKQLKIEGWDWAGDIPKLPINPVTGQKPPVDKSPHRLGEYCWCAYDKAYSARGDQVIGRVNHLAAAALFEKVADIVGKHTLFDQTSQGNLLKMDKWARVVNDSWILGGVHRFAMFRLASPRAMENLWNFSIGAPVVTAREILGLLHFGYQLQQVGPWQVLSCADKGRAAAASLLEYDRLMNNQMTVRSVLKLVDKSRLGMA